MTAAASTGSGPRIVDGRSAVGEAGFRAWLLDVQAAADPAPPPRTLAHRATLPLRAARRFRAVADDVGTKEAVVLGAGYVRRRLLARRA